MSIEAAFVYRTSPDGTKDSICTKCFYAVATGIDEAALHTKEEDHIFECLPLSKVVFRLRPAARKIADDIDPSSP